MIHDTNPSLVLSLVLLFGLLSLLVAVYGHTSRGQARRSGQKASSVATASAVIGRAGLALMIGVIPVMNVG